MTTATPEARLTGNSAGSRPEFGRRQVHAVAACCFVASSAALATVLAAALPALFRRSLRIRWSR
jgi:hypothetical protein